MSGSWIPFASGVLRGPENSGETKSYAFDAQPRKAYLFRVKYKHLELLPSRVISAVEIDSGAFWRQDTIMKTGGEEIHHLPLLYLRPAKYELVVSSVANRLAPSVVEFTAEYVEYDVPELTVAYGDGRQYPSVEAVYGWYEFPSGGEIVLRHFSPFDRAIYVRVVLGGMYSTGYVKEVRIEPGETVKITVPKNQQGNLMVQLKTDPNSYGFVGVEVVKTAPTVPAPTPPAPQPSPPTAPPVEPAPAPPGGGYPDIWDVLKDYMRRIIRDELPVTVDPFITKALISVNAAIFLFVVSQLDSVIMTYGLIPALVVAGEWFRMLTHMYLHADFFSHLAMNMTFLFVFGDNVEEKTTWRYIFYYHLFGLAGALGYLVHALAVPELMITPAVGASGAVAGVLGYYFVTWPYAKVVFMGRVMPAYAFGALFFLEQIVLAFTVSNVAWSAHLAGLIAGIVTGVLDKRRT